MLHISSQLRKRIFLHILWYNKLSNTVDRETEEIFLSENWSTTTESLFWVMQTKNWHTSNFLDHQKQVHLKHSTYSTSQNAKIPSEEKGEMWHLQKREWIKNMLCIIQEVLTFCFHLLRALTALTKMCYCHISQICC